MFIVLIALIPVTLVTLAFTPALLLLPFFSSRHPVPERMVRQLATWTRALLLASRER